MLNSPKLCTSLWQKVLLFVFGFFLAVILLEAGLRLGGFIILSLQDYRNAISLSHKGAYRILCLGDGITQGEYPPFLEKILNQSNTGIQFSVIDKGRGGLNTRSILSQVESYINEYHPDMVVAMMGINDESWEGHIPYERPTSSKPLLFIRSFKTYKFARLLWLHMITKAKELGLYKAQNKDSFPYGLKEPYVERGDAKKNEATLTKIIEHDPRNDDAYAKLGWTCGNQGKFTQAEEFLKKAIELNPENAEAYIGLGWIRKAQGNFPQAEELIRKAIKLDPRNDDGYFRLGWLYIDQDKLPQAEELFKKTLECNPKHAYAYIRLGGIYRNQGKFSQAEELIKKAILGCDFNQKARFYGALASIYEAMGKTTLSKEYYDKANQTRLNEYLPLVNTNYLKLKDILYKKHIKLVCVQYPMRSIEPLKEIFKDDADGIIFVDNESIFKNAVRQQGFKQYFRDMFGGDFGHCTPEGNRLLAENITEVILKRVFHKVR
jgi:tetratricopeptide (TPR) repeat protein